MKMIHCNKEYDIFDFKFFWTDDKIERFLNVNVYSIKFLDIQDNCSELIFYGNKEKLIIYCAWLNYIIKERKLFVYNFYTKKDYRKDETSDLGIFYSEIN